ncbi:hypothetical protein [Paenibacillus illinoisensis]|uniref:hypothetical protein n=1 Tax=Paenibacillus illinoisensis TaxID=59845 RepID=UPI001C8E9E3E|nr:hypothetical protein [Paenibacillus illinoisensis]
MEWQIRGSGGEQQGRIRDGDPLVLLILDCLRGVDIIEEKGMGEDGQWRMQ